MLLQSNYKMKMIGTGNVTWQSGQRCSGAMPCLPVIGYVEGNVMRIHV